MESSLYKSTFLQKDNKDIMDVISSSLFIRQRAVTVVEEKKEKLSTIHCNCFISPDHNYCDSIKHVLFGISKYGGQSTKDFKMLYIKTKNECSTKTLDQINRDIIRTYSDEDYFKYQKNQNNLRSLLVCISNIDPEVGYVQGMSYIAGALLYHSSEEVSYWIFNQLMISPKYHLIDIFSKGFPGMMKHCAIIELLYQLYYPDVFKYMADKNYCILYYACPWIITMFTSDVPLSGNLNVLINFSQQGWMFIYTLFLSIVGKNKKKILNDPLTGNRFSTFQNDYSWSPFKAVKKMLNKDKFMKSNTADYWSSIIEYANTFNLNPIYINYLYDRYDPIKKEFKDTKIDLTKLKL